MHISHILYIPNTIYVKFLYSSENFTYSSLPKLLYNVHSVEGMQTLHHIRREDNPAMKTKKTILLPIARQFIIVLITFTVCTVCVTLYSAYDYSRLQTSFLNNSLESYSAHLAKSTREAYESYENICYSIAYSQVVLKFLTSGSNQNTYESYRQLENQLSNTALLNPYIIDIAVYGQDDIFASLCSSASNYEGFSRSLSDSRFPYRSAGVATINGTLCHILAMPVYSLGTGESRYLGILFLAIDINSLLGSNLKSDENDYDPKIIFTDSDQRLIYGEEALYNALCLAGGSSDVFQIRDASDKSISYAVTSYSVPGVEHTLYVLIDKTRISRQVSEISGRLLLVMGTMTALVFLFLFLLYRPLIRSLKQLTDFMNTISSGNRRAIKDGAVISQGLIGSSEINEISTAFNDMLIETEKLNHTIFDTYTRMYELEANNRKTEIAFLRSQINPHFLYNTLTIICGLAAEGMDDKIISVTGALSQIFRYSIKGSDMVTLREEMTIVKSYLMIQQERFEDRFTIRYEFSEDSHDCLIPKMVIQPLVENAIVHGLEKSLKPGELLIGTGRNPEHGYLAIWIFDTGVGMPQSRLKELRDSILCSTSRKTGNAPADLAELDSLNHDSIGILNVNSRMVLYYGEEYTLIIDSEEGVGTNIQLRIPYRTRAEGEENVSGHSDR